MKINDPYFIRKGEYFFRHNSRGYTVSPLEAEIYEKHTAFRLAFDCKDCFAVRVSDILTKERLNQYMERLGNIYDHLNHPDSIDPEIKSFTQEERG